MSEEKHVPMEEMTVFQWYVEVADWAWERVGEWAPLAQDTVGKQLVKALDSVGANLVEGDGRYSTGDALHFFVIARASAREGRYWLQRAARRDLISRAEADEKIAALTSATRLLNNLITYRRKAQGDTRVRELQADYDAADIDPFTVE